MSVDQCKQIFADALSKHLENKNSRENLDSKVFQYLRQHEDDLEFDYCLENFANLCRFCCQLKTDSRVIYDDSSEELLKESNELMQKIHYTLYDIVS